MTSEQVDIQALADDIAALNDVSAAFESTGDPWQIRDTLISSIVLDHGPELAKSLYPAITEAIERAHSIGREHKFDRSLTVAEVWALAEEALIKTQNLGVDVRKQVAVAAVQLTETYIRELASESALITGYTENMVQDDGAEAGMQ